LMKSHGFLQRRDTQFLGSNVERTISIFLAQLSTISRSQQMIGKSIVNYWHNSIENGARNGHQLQSGHFISGFFPLKFAWISILMYMRTATAGSLKKIFHFQIFLRKCCSLASNTHYYEWAVFCPNLFFMDDSRIDPISPSESKAKHFFSAVS
jgi:hypothetical protein